MPRKSKRGEIPQMSKMTIAEQDIAIQRWRLRNDLRTLYPEIVDTMLQWVIDIPNIAEFVAGGHKTHFSVAPEQDLILRMEANGFSQAEITAAINSDDVAADWMTPEEADSVIVRITEMKKYFTNHDPGPFAQALTVYELLGRLAREQFIEQYGYAPEQSEIPRVKIQGKDSELKKLKPSNHQPPLM